MRHRQISWYALLPFAALGSALLAQLFHGATWTILLGALLILPAVLSAVHHADIVAHRVGEPYGALILALAVTLIESALIITLMLQVGSGNESHATLTRDAIFATLMIVLNGVIGLSLLLGSLRHHTQEYRVEGAAPALAVLIALSVLTLVLPRFTTTTPDPSYSPLQLIFDAAVSLTLWSVFIFSQAVRHRADYLAVADQTAKSPSTPRPRPGAPQARRSLGLLFVALVAVVGLAESLAPGIERSIEALGLPAAVIGIVIALLVLLPETLTAIRAARRNQRRIQG